MLKVGASIACINPAPEMYPLPRPKKQDWGLTPVDTTGPYDDMNCRAIAIDNGKDKILFLAYELSEVPKIPDLTAVIAAETGFPEENVCVFATHNHTGMRDEDILENFGGSEEEWECLRKFKEILKAQGLCAAKEAVYALRPAKYGYGEIDSYVNTNRDYETLGGYWTEARNLAGYSDKTLSIIKFVDEEDKLIAAFLNYPCHATCGYLMKDFDHNRKTSGNFTGIACRFVEERYGEGAVCLWTSGAAGNQNPLLSHGLQYEYSDGWTSAVDYPDGVGFMQMELMGRTHGADAVRGIEQITSYTNRMPIKHLRKSVYLPARIKEKVPNPAPFRMGGRGADRSDVPYGQLPPVPSGPRMVDDPDHPVELKMQLIMLGDIAMVGANAELYCQIGRDIKEALPYKKAMVVTHTEPVRVGYILDKSSAHHKTFQAFHAVKPGAADELIVQGALELCEAALSD